ARVGAPRRLLERRDRGLGRVVALGDPVTLVRPAERGEESATALQSGQNRQGQQEARWARPPRFWSRPHAHPLPFASSTLLSRCASLFGPSRGGDPPRGRRFPCYKKRRRVRRNR